MSASELARARHGAMEKFGCFLHATYATVLEMLGGRVCKTLEDWSAKMPKKICQDPRP